MKKLMVLAAAVALALGTRADLLYFLASYGYYAGSQPVDFARVGVADSNGQVLAGDSPVYLNILNSDPATPWVESSDRVMAGPAYAVITDDYANDGYSFYIETWVGDEMLWGYSAETAASYSSLLAAGHIWKDDTSLQTVTPWAVPEPTGGTLLLLGLAALGLRRKQHEV